MTATEKELLEARDMLRVMLGEHKSEGTPVCDECEGLAERIVELEAELSEGKS